MAAVYELPKSSVSLELRMDSFRSVSGLCDVGAMQKSIPATEVSIKCASKLQADKPQYNSECSQTRGFLQKKKKKKFEKKPFLDRAGDVHSSSTVLGS